MFPVITALVRVVIWSPLIPSRLWAQLWPSARIINDILALQKIGRFDGKAYMAQPDQHLFLHRKESEHHAGEAKYGFAPVEVFEVLRGHID